MTDTNKKAVWEGWNDFGHFQVQDGLDIYTGWKVVNLGKGPAMTLELNGQEYMRFDCLGKDKGHFHVRLSRPKLEPGQPAINRLFFFEKSVRAQVGRSVFEIRKNLGYYLQRHPDAAVRVMNVDRPSLVSACRSAREKMLEYLDTVPELADLRGSNEPRQA